MDDRFWDNLSIFNISVVSGARHCGRVVDNSLYGRANCGFLYIWRGEAEFYGERGEKITVSDGELLFLPKHKRYKMKYTAESTVFVLVNFEITDASGKECSLFDDFTLLAKDDELGRFANIMKSFELCSAPMAIGTTLRKKELVYRLLGAVYASTPGLLCGYDIDSKISEGVRLLEKTYLENLPISKFSDACYMSINTFRSLFQKQFGTSPVKYRNNLRMERAKELLSEGSFTVSEVAYHSGFENIGYFCRYYRQITGESPSETKKKNKI